MSEDVAPGRKGNRMKQAMWALIAVVLVAYAAVLHYCLPRYEVVRIVNTEVRRVDTQSGDSVSGSAGTAQTRDIFFISAKKSGGDKTRVYRNEDNTWYLKFNAADVQAEAADINKSDGYAAVKYYGWRVAVFSMFPNVISINKSEENASIVPWNTILILIALFAVKGGIYWKIRQYRKRRAA